MTTFTIQIELPETFDVESRGVVQSVNVKELMAAHPTIATDAALHGIKQKVADAAASAVKDAMGDAFDKASKAEKEAFAEEHADKVKESTANLMAKANKRLLDEGWKAATRTSTADPLAKFVRAVLVRLINGTGQEKKLATYKLMATAAKKNEYLQTVFDKAPEESQAKIRAAAQAMYDAELAAKQKAAQAAGAISI